MNNTSKPGTLSHQQLAENFDDLHKPLNKLQVITEAARCTYYYDVPDIKACPTAIDIPILMNNR